MSNEIDTAAQIKQAQVFTCKSCGKNFVVRKCVHPHQTESGSHQHCHLCWKAFRIQRKKEWQMREDLISLQKKVENQKIFEDSLTAWNVQNLNAVHLSSNALYIIGNGFDLMHGVKSSYYSFRDSLGKRNFLRNLLDSFWTPDDIWADFEAGLAHFNMDAMGSRCIADNWLEYFDAYTEDATAASFFMAAEAAATPMAEVSTLLPRRFRSWVQTLSIGTDDRPLKNLFSGGKVLNFNYTELVESLYGVNTSDVCYIHGCRKNKKEKLILGHQFGASDDSYHLSETSPKRKPTYRSGLIGVAQDHIFALVSSYDEYLTKNCHSIIAANRAFFNSIRHVQDIILIGHSMSRVDWDYFEEIAHSLENFQGVIWYIGVHSLRDLENMEALRQNLHIEKKNIVLFRTDTVHVNLYPQVEASKKGKAPSVKVLGKSPNQKWQAERCGSVFRIVDLHSKYITYDVLLTQDVQKAFFDISSTYLFVIIHGIHPGVMLFSQNNGTWELVNELEGIPNQGVLNKRLKKVFLNGAQITFVYNNRVRRFRLSDGVLAANLAVQNAPAKDYSQDGMDVTKWFVCD